MIHSTQRPKPSPPAATAAHICLQNGRALYLGPGLKLQPHRNSVATLVIGMDHHFELSRHATGLKEFEHRRLAVIAPNTLHHLRRTTGTMAFLYLDALGDDWASLNEPSLDTQALAVTNMLNEAFQSPPAQWLDAALEALSISPKPRHLRRLSATVRAIDRAPQHFARVETAAKHARLSVSRFQHVFRAEMGMPFRRYRLWRRMAIVAAQIAAGHSLTHAAHEAGFASSAHLSSTFKEMFGLPPSALVATGMHLVQGH